jgi:hypothetical protein
MKSMSTSLLTIKMFRKATISIPMQFEKESKTKSAKPSPISLWYQNKKPFRKSKKMTIISSKESNSISRATTTEFNKFRLSWRKDKKE